MFWSSLFMNVGHFWSYFQLLWALREELVYDIACPYLIFMRSWDRIKGNNGSQTLKLDGHNSRSLLFDIFFLGDTTPGHVWASFSHLYLRDTTPGHVFHILLGCGHNFWTCVWHLFLRYITFVRFFEFFFYSKRSIFFFFFFFKYKYFFED